MKLPQDQAGAPAVDIFRKAIGVPPEIQSDRVGGKSAAAYFWRTPYLSSYALSEADEVILAMHTGGSRNVRTLMQGGWSHDSSSPGHLHLIPAGVSTAFKPDGWIEFISVHFARERLEQLAEQGVGKPSPVPFRFAYHDSFASGCIAALIDELRMPRELGSLFVDSLTDTLSLHLMRSATTAQEQRGGSESLSSGVLSRVKDRILDNLEAGVSLDDLAAEAGLSRFHFARAFRRATGLPPHNFLTRCRIERAKELLLHTDLSLAEIALTVGFSSQSHFSARFRGWVGQTPRDFRVRQ